MKSKAEKERKKPAPATKSRAPSRLELTRGVEETRLFIQLAGNYVHRLDMDRQRLYAGDLDMARVAGAVALGSMEANLRLPEFRQKYRDLRTVIGVDAQRGTNAMSIAQYTGIPRETVRRKLKRLVEFGAVTEKTRGAYVITPGFPQQPQSLTVIEAAMRYTLQFMNDCLSLGLVRLADSSD